MRVNVDNDSRDISENEEDNITDELRLFADWIYSQLESEYEYLQSDECIDEYLAEFEYTEDGESI
jgi:vacuolar-type H+-ATPase subunit I/STV1